MPEPAYSLAGFFNILLGSGRLRTGQIVDGQQAEEGQPFSFNLRRPSCSFRSTITKACVTVRPGAPGSRNSLEKRASAREHIVDDHGSIPWLHSSFDQLPESMVLRFLPHHEGPPLPAAGPERKVRDGGGNRDRPDFQPSKAVEFDRTQCVMRKLPTSRREPG